MSSFWGRVHDTVNRLTHATLPGSKLESGPAGSNVAAFDAPHTQDYTYDAVGNRTKLVEANAGHTVTTTYHYTENKLMSWDDSDGKGKTYGYDAGGNLAGPAYDSQSRMVSHNGVDFTYGADGSRCRRNQTTAMVTQGLKTLAEFDLSGAAPKAKAYYWHGANGLLALKKTFDLSDQTKPARELWYQQDHLGSSTLLSDSKGHLVKTLHYMPFGESIEGADQQNKTRFTGQEEDDEVGLQYFHARWYDPSVGRFTQVDPMANLNGKYLSGYEYVNNSPLVYTDPDGRNPQLVLLLALVAGGAGIYYLVSETGPQHEEALKAGESHAKRVAGSDEEDSIQALVDANKLIPKAGVEAVETGNKVLGLLSVADAAGAASATEKMGKLSEASDVAVGWVADAWNWLTKAVSSNGDNQKQENPVTPIIDPSRVSE